MDTPPPPPGPDVNRTIGIYLAVWLPFPVAFAFVAARFYIRTKINGLGLDDYFMFACMATFIGAITVTMIYVLGGGERHLYYLEPAQTSKLIKYNFIAQVFGIVSSSCGKISVGFLILRIVGPNNPWKKWLLYICLSVFSLLSALTIILQYAQCNPTSALWEQNPNAKCWDRTIFPKIATAQSSLGTFMDFVLGLLPIAIARELSFTKKKKIVLCVLLGLGNLTGICAAIKTAQLHLYASESDFTWATYDIFTWAFAEIHLIIICGCVPTLRPLYERIFENKELKSRSRSYNLKGSRTAKDASVLSSSATASRNNWVELPETSSQARLNKSITVVRTFDREIEGA